MSTSSHIIAAAFVFLLRLFAQAEAPTAKDLLARLQANERLLASFRIEASWEEMKNGRPVGWEEQSISRDSLERMRLFHRWGTFEADGNRARPDNVPDSEDMIYDGEKTVVKRYFANRDRVGAPLGGNGKPRGYRTVDVYSGKSPPSGLESYRNPLFFAVEPLASGLAEAIGGGRDVSVRKAPENGNLYTVEFQRNPKNELPGVVRQRAVLDAAKGWLPVRIDSLGKNGQLVRRITCDYATGEQQLWLPLRGGLRHFENRKLSDSPLWEWRFLVKKIQLNEADFGESAFKVSLEPDTAVWDSRYKVNYRIGDQEALGDQLDALAKQAKETNSSKLDDVRDPSKWRTWFIAITIAILLALALAWVFLRRHFKGVG